MRRVYMDANATTPLLPEVMEAMRPYWMEHFGNASSIHLHGQQAHAAVDRARETMAEFFNCHEAEVVFNSGGTEGDNTAIFGLLRPGDHFITTSIEHSAVLQAAKRVAQRGVETTFVAPQPSGLIDPAEIRRAIRPETRLISVMLANNETGVLQPVEEIGKIAAEAGVFFHIDAVQGAGKVEFDVRRFGCHLSPSAPTRCTGPRALAPCLCAAELPLSRCWWAAATSAASAPALRMCPASWAWPRPRNWPCTRLADGTIDRLAALRDRLEAEILQIPGTGVNGAYPMRSSWRRVEDLGSSEPCSPRGQHHQHLVRSTGGRGAGDRAGPEGRCRSPAVRPATPAPPSPATC